MFLSQATKRWLVVAGFVLGVSISVRVLLPSVLAWGDVALVSSLSKQFLWNTVLFVWDHANMGTSPRMSFGSVLPLSATYLPFVNDLGIYFILRIAPFFLLPLVAYWFIKKLVGSNVVATIGAIFALANPVVVGDFMNGQTLWVYPCLLIATHLFIQIFFRHNFHLSRLVSLAVLLFFVFGFLPPVIVPLVVVFSIFCGISLLHEKAVVHRTRIAQSIIIVAALFGLMASPYLLVTSSGQQAYKNVTTLSDYYHNYSKTNLSNAFRLGGNAGNGQEILGYNDPSVRNVAGYVLILVMFVALMVRSDQWYSDRVARLILLATLVVALLLLGFLHLLTVDRSFGTWIFSSQLIVGTIRNPAKVFLLVWVFFVVAFAFGLKALLERLVNRRPLQVSVGVVVVASLLVYSWPALRGDFGLFHSVPKEKRMAASEIDPMVALADPIGGRSLIIPSDHDDELRFQNRSRSLNTLRLGGDYPATQELRRKLVDSLKSQSQDFLKYADISGIRTIFLKNDLGSTSLRFPIFPLKNDLVSTAAFLDSHFLRLGSTEFATYLNTETLPIIGSAGEVYDLVGKADYDEISSLYSGPDSLVLTSPSHSVAFAHPYSVVAQEDGFDPGSSVMAVLRDPEIVTIKLDRTSANLVLSRVLPSGEVNQERTVATISSPDIVKIGGRVVDLRSGSEEFSVRSGEYAMDLYSLEPIEIAEDAASFEGTQKLTVADASVSRPGPSAIRVGRDPDHTHGSSSLALGSEGHNAYHRVQLPIGDISSSYFLSFDYRHIEGTPATFSVWQNGTNISAAFGTLAPSSEWRRVTASFLPTPGTTSIDLYLYTDSRDGRLSKNLFDNVQLYKEKRIQQEKITVSGNPRTIGLSDVPLSSRRTFDRDDNLLVDPSFERGTLSDWESGDASLAKPGDPQIEASISKEAIDGDFALSLSSKNHTGYVSQNVRAFDPHSSYRITFRYKNISGSKPSFSVWQTGTNRSSPSQTLSDADNQWREYETIFVPDKDSTGARVYFYTGSVNGEESRNLFDDVRLEKVSPIKSYIVDEGFDHRLAPDLSVQSFEEVNPTLYHVRVQGSRGAVYLNESFHDGWRAYVGDLESRELRWWHAFFKPSGFIPLSYESHRVANGFANAWMIENLDSNGSDVIIEFVPQRWFYVGLLVSGATLIGCLGYLGVAFVRGRRKKAKNPLHLRQGSGGRANPFGKGGGRDSSPGIGEGGRGISSLPPPAPPVPGGEKNLGASLLRDVRERSAKPKK